MKRLSACALSLALSVSMILPAGAAGAALSDVPPDHWAHPHVEALTQKGVVTGVGEGRFHPDGELVTAGFAVMLTPAFCPEGGGDPGGGGARGRKARCPPGPPPPRRCPCPRRSWT